MKKVIIFLIFIIAIIAGVIVGMNFKNSNKETGKDQIKSENKVNVTSEITENATTENTTSKEEATVQNNNKEEGIDVNSFKGVWHYPDSVYPDDELIIKNIDGNKITFDYVIDGITSFENVTANLDKNIATFDVKNEGDWNIKGTMEFKENSIEFTIKESSNENVPTINITFDKKSNKSILQGVSY